MKRILILTVMLIATMLLTGCEHSVGANGGCIGSNSISPKCSVEASYTITWKSVYSDFDASLASIDMSQSNVDITNNSGNIVISVKNTNGATIATSIFQWYRIGNEVFPSNPSSMSNFVNANLQHNNTLEFDVEGMETTSNNGTNNFVAIFKYDENSVGASDSFFLNNADLNGF